MAGDYKAMEKEEKQPGYFKMAGLNLKQKQLMTLIILTGSAFDAISTQMGIQSGYLTEVNPFLNMALQVWPDTYVWGVKLFFAFLLAGVLSFFEVPEWVEKATIGIARILALVVLWHWVIIVHALRAV